MVPGRAAGEAQLARQPPDVVVLAVAGIRGAFGRLAREVANV